MIRILLDNTEVYPKEDTDITITRENPLLTNAGSYSLNIVLPLKIGANRRFFGNMDRKDTRKNNANYKAELYDGAKRLVAGRALLTGMEEGCATIQILGGNSSVKFWETVQDRYVDELELTVVDGQDIVTEWADSQKRQYAESAKQFNKTYPFPGIPGKFCFAPFTDETNGKTGNAFSTSWQYDTYDIYGKEDKGEFLIDRFGNATSVMPSLAYVLERILALEGYSLEKDAVYDNAGLKDIYIASARPTWKIQDALPHWTVEEFIGQVEKFCYATLEIDDTTYAATLRSNGREKKTIVIDDIVDEFEVHISEDEENGYDTSNVKYSENGNRVEILPKEYAEGNRIVEFETYSDLENGSADMKWNILQVRSTGRRYMRDTNGAIHECDIYGFVNRNSEDTTELKITPARKGQEFTGRWTEYACCDVTPYGTDASGRELKLVKNEYRTLQNYITGLLLENAWGGWEGSKGSLYDTLAGTEDVENKEEKKDKEDFLPIFYLEDGNPGKILTGIAFYMYYSVVKAFNGTDWEIVEWKNKTHYGQIPLNVYYNIPVIYTDFQTNGCVTSGIGSSGEIYEETRLKSGNTLDLKRSDSNAVGNWHHRNRNTLNTKVVQVVSFMAQVPPDPCEEFHIRGKRYECQKIEYHVTDMRLDTLMTGYFMEIL